MQSSVRTKFADIYVGIPVEGTFTYRVPPGVTVRTGMRVIVNFSNRETIAFIHRVHNNEPEGYAVKDILNTVESFPIFDERLIDLASAVARQYVCSVGEVLSMALPSSRRMKHRSRETVHEGENQPITLSSQQQQVYDDIFAMKARGRRHHLIYGITGSGKTEVYIELARYFLERNQSVIYLVPEISLSSQIYSRLSRVFGETLIRYHSNLTPNQRLDNWVRFYRGDARIVIGTRSAVFMQCPDLGLIIIDEEHDGSYKENSTPRYNARRLAMYRSKKDDCLMVIGSATPSIESLYAAERGLFGMHSMDQRYGGAELPDIDIVTINPYKPDEMLSPRLRLHSKKAIEEGNQVIYLLNRRGFSPLLICNECKDVVECPSCNISLNVHSDGFMYCHYCGYKRRVQEQCGKCGSNDLVKLGAGTQRLEEIIPRVFGESRVFRLDQDSSRKKNTIVDMIEKMNSGKIDILVGTQMVAKGFDFHGVTTVGILMADIGMNLPDFRASERIFALLIQVAGRCGRGDTPGRVIVQTLTDEHHMFEFLKNHDYLGFYKHELSVRKALDYPPFSRMARLLVRGKNEKKVVEAINLLRSLVDSEVLKRGNGVSVLGPSQSPILKIASNYRYHLLLKSKDGTAVRDIVHSVKKDFSSRDTYLEIDIDPYDML